MHRKKLSIVVFIAILLAALVFFFGGDPVDQDLIQQLARKQVGDDALSSGASTAGQDDRFRRLTSETFATKEPSKRSWAVGCSKPGSSTTAVLLPFDPTGEVESPAAGAVERQPAAGANPGFMGADVCAECHLERHREFVETGHHQTSALMRPDLSAHGSFTSPENVVKTDDPNLFFTMDRSGQQVVQEVTLGDWSRRFPMEVVVGSAKVGQSYLYWRNDALYQAHVSYLTSSDAWIPSPGFANTQADFSRSIRIACLECHITYIERVKRPNHYDRESAIWGISCERCHGPGRQHVEYHRAHPTVKKSKHITHPRSLPRERQLDICGQCHSGGFSLRQEAFMFRPGNELDQYHRQLQPSSDKVGGIHTSDQLDRLKKSQCFKKSEMTCTTCHNPHKNQRGNTAVFTESCLGCHQSDHCGMETELGQRISQDCISCHMPISQNEDMANLADGDLPIFMADHYIRVDHDATKRYLAD